MCEVNPWQRQIGCGRPRIGGTSVSETDGLRDAVNRAGSKRSHETRRRREAARRAEMNETYGMSASEVISQGNPVSNYHPDLSRFMQVWLSCPNLSRDMQV